MSEIVISNVERKDDGLYECQARNEGGAFFKSGHIQVTISYIQRHRGKIGIINNAWFPVGTKNF